MITVRIIIKTQGTKYYKQFGTNYNRNNEEGDCLQFICSGKKEVWVADENGCNRWDELCG